MTPARKRGKATRREIRAAQLRDPALSGRELRVSLLQKLDEINRKSISSLGGQV